MGSPVRTILDYTRIIEKPKFSGEKPADWTESHNDQEKVHT